MILMPIVQNYLRSQRVDFSPTSFFFRYIIMSKSNRETTSNDTMDFLLNFSPFFILSLFVSCVAIALINFNKMNCNPLNVVWKIIRILLEQRKWIILCCQFILFNFLISSKFNWIHIEYCFHGDRNVHDWIFYCFMYCKIYDKRWYCA